VAGIFVPIMSTTPFFLLAAACIMKSSAKLHYWLIHHRLFGVSSTSENIDERND
jgi:uncharacterized membrane protein YbaN (DUF454 family)